MHKLQRFARLPLADQLWLIRAAIVVLLVWVALRILSFQAVHNVLSRVGDSADLERREPDTQKVARIIRAVDIASNFLLSQRPCLTKALVAQALLRREAYTTTLRIGVRRTGDNQLNAHAWLERDGEIIIGQLPNLQAFTPLPPLELKKV